MILGQTYITCSRMETKVLDDGSAYARIRGIDGKHGVQYLIVHQDHNRDKEELKVRPFDNEDDMSYVGSDF